ncbi:MAG TPA: TPM domain-containing protein [Candidatus Micrarchaeaceae archaeon]|nr:TPM domain-containing protein [Candidatus Micrarchaeaceae archaeon]
MPYRRAKQPGPLLRRRSVGTARSIHLSALTLLLALSVAPRVALAQSVDQVAAQAKQGYVTDLAGVLSQSGKNQLTALCAEVQQKTQAQIAVVTIKSLNGDSIDGYAPDLFAKIGIGAKSTDRGVLILFSIDDHRYRTEVGYGLEPILPDGKVGTFGREAVPYLRQGNYDAAILLVTRRIADTIAADRGVTLTSPSTVPQLPQNVPGAPGIPLIFIIVVIFVIIGAIRRASRGGVGPRYGGGSGWWVGPMIGGMMGGGFRGGGFGGGGGGGFGGFGGGMSGGGGASGGW